MKFVNDTPFGARLLRTEIAEGRMLNAAIARIRYAIEPDGELRPLEHFQQRDDIRVEATDLAEYGVLHPDSVYPRTGVDVIVLGDVTPAEPVRQAEVKLRAGPYQLDLRVFGQRVWDRGAIAGLSSTNPTLFTRMPLSWSNAYGGSAHSEHGELPFPKNPSGKGFILIERHAVGVQLPNLEFADCLIKRWDDRPNPANLGPYPRRWGMRTELIMAPDVEAGEMRYFPERGMFDQAAPYLGGRTFGDEIAEPARFCIEGLRAKPIVFELPPCPFAVAANIGDIQYEQPLKLEEIVVDLRASECAPNDSVGVSANASLSGSTVAVGSRGQGGATAAAAADRLAKGKAPAGPPRYRDTVELCYRRSFHYEYVPRQRRRAWLRLRSS